MAPRDRHRKQSWKGDVLLLKVEPVSKLPDFAFAPGRRKEGGTAAFCLCGGAANEISSSVVKHFKAIAAMSLNRVIGRGHKIPWHLPEDFQWFKKMTTGQVVVMGRKTFESIGRPLPHRETLVLSRQQFSFPGVRTVSGLGEIDVAKENREVFICGGAQIYAQALPLCSDLFLTLVKREVEGDTFFPPYDPDSFVEVAREPHLSDDGTAFAFVTYVRSATQ